MAYSSAVHIEQTSKHLVDVALGLDRREVLDFQKLVKVLVECLHRYVEFIVFALVGAECGEGFD